MKQNLKKLLAFGLCLCLLFTAKAQTNMQQKISVDYRNQPLEQVLKDLKEKYQIRFSYSNQDIPLKRSIRLQAKQKPLSYVLDELCKQSDLTWKFLAGQVLLKSRKEEEKKSGVSLKGNIKGRIIDKDSKLPLIGVGVRLVSVEPEQGTISNAEGEFFIPNVPLGRHELLSTYLGFEPVVIPQIMVGSSKEVVLQIEMSSSLKDLQAVTVSAGVDRSTALNEMAMTSARSFTVEETSRYAASNFDPARMAQNFAGVTINDDVSNDIVVRGNSPKGLQWRLEGIEINNPNHFGEEGSSGGGISMISSNILANSDFFTGAFPAEYGNALSGVFDLRFRKGNPERKEHTFMIGALGTEISTEGPFNEKHRSSYLLNYRYSTLGILESFGLKPAGDNPTPKYQDLAFHLNFPSKDNSATLSLFGIMGYAHQNGVASKDSTGWDGFDDKFNRKNSYISASTGIKHLKTLNNNAYLKNIISLSFSDIRDNADTLDQNYNANVYGRDKFQNTVLRYSGMFNYKSSPSTTLRTGLNASLMGFDLRSLTYKSNIGRLSEFIDTQGTTGLLDAYGQVKHYFNSKWKTNFGLHLSYLALSQDLSLEPRAGISFEPDEKNKFGIASGIYSRMEPVALYFAKNELPDGSVIHSNKSLELTKSWHLVFSYERKLSSLLKLKTEAYYQHLYDVPVTVNPAVNFSALNVSDAYFFYNRNYGVLNNSGEGRNFGLDVSLERSFSRGFYLLANGSVFRSTFNNQKGEEFSTTFNGSYAANLLAGKEFKGGPDRKNVWGINAKFLLNGGRRYSPINLEESIKQDYPIIYEDRVNTLQAPAYFRIDASATYRVNMPKVSHLFYIDIQNLLNRENIRELFYNADDFKIDTVFYTGIIPTFNYKIEF